MFGKLSNLAGQLQTAQQTLQSAGILQTNQTQQQQPQQQQQQQQQQQPTSQPGFIGSLQQYQQQLNGMLQSGQQTTALDGTQVSLSSCMGNKKAVFVGINYFGTKSELKGCINDVKNVKNFIFQNYNFTPNNSLTLTDDQQDPLYQPTKKNIIEALKWLVMGASPGDSLFFHYSGHGGSVKDESGDDPDGFDETIIPLDYEQAGFILDDELYEILVRQLPKGVRLTAIFDSCHSGTALDLPFTYKVDGSLEISLIDNRLEAGKAFLFAGLNYFQGNTRDAFLKAKEGVGYLLQPQVDQSKVQQQQQQKIINADVIQWGGCKDAQTSADANIEGQATGAMSHAFVKALTQNKNVTYAELLKITRQFLDEGRYSQIPQLSTGNKMNINVPFIM